MITNTQVSTTVTNIFSSLGENAITTVFFCNTSPDANAQLDVFAVPSAGTHGTGTQIMSNLSLPASETFVFDLEKLILEDGAALWAQSTVDKIVTATVSSVRTS